MANGLSSELCRLIRERKGWGPNELLVLMHIADLGEARGEGGHQFSAAALRKYYDLRPDASGKDLLDRMGPEGDRILTHDPETGTVGISSLPWGRKRRGMPDSTHDAQAELPSEPGLPGMLSLRNEGARPAGADPAAAVDSPPPPRRLRSVNSERLDRERSFEPLTGEQLTVRGLTAQKLEDGKWPTPQQQAALLKRIEAFQARFDGAEAARKDLAEHGGDWRKNYVRPRAASLSEALDMLTGEAEEDGWRPNTSAWSALKFYTRKRAAERRQLV